MRKKLTDQEYNIVMKYTANLKVDSSFDIYDCGDTDKWKDYDKCKMLSLNQGFTLLYDAVAYPFQHDGLTVNEGEILANLFKEFVSDINEEYLKHLTYDKEE